MFLKNRNILFVLFSIIFFLLSHMAYSNTNYKIKLIDHLSSLENFSASFLQDDGENLSEGKVYIGSDRVRAEYYTPTKILIILDENKGMYYNYDLEEDEFFNTKNTNAWFFYDIFRNPSFFEDGKIELNDNELILRKNWIDREEKKYSISVYFENNPLVLRKVAVKVDQDSIKLSIYDHNYNEKIDKKFFKLINPSFF